MPTQDELQQLFHDFIARYAGGDAPTEEEIEEAFGDDVLADVGRDEYVPALDAAMDAAGVPADLREPLYEELDGEGNYDAAGLRDNFRAAFQNEEITNAIDNSITVEGGGGGYDDHGYDNDPDVHDITQHNTDNQANASGDGAIAGRDQWGQFQTGDGAQSGDYNDGVVFQGENEGQVAGGNADAGDITGDGGINVGGHVDNSGFGTGSGNVTVNVDQSEDHSVHDSENQENVGNTDNSWNQDNVDNTDVVSEHSYDESLEANLTVEDSFTADYKVEDHDDHDHDYGHADLDH
jgi:hypothetical protein